MRSVAQHGVWPILGSNTVEWLVVRVKLNGVNITDSCSGK